MTMFASRHLAADDRGIAAVEFAIIAPVLIVMICGFMEFAHVSSARTTLEAATMRAARAVAATDCPSERQALMQSVISDGMASVARVPNTNIVVTTKAYSSQFSDVGEPEPFNDANANGRWDTGESYTDVNGNGQYNTDMGRTGSIGTAGQVVSYTARIQVASLFGFINYRYGADNAYTLEASTVIRNEPVFRTSGCAT
jgi:Flp pilus assembly protein TadG